jgi:hypothetical protein
MIDKGHRPSDAYTAEVYDVIIGKTVNQDIEYALDLVRVQEHKETLQAFFLCGASLQQISSALSIEIPVLESVHRLVMDESKFRNKLERFTYARDLVETEGRLTERGEEYIRTGLMHGPDVLSQHFRLGNEEVILDPKKLIGHFVETAYYLSANARGNSITAETTKQARMWMLDTIKYLEAHKDAASALGETDEALLAIEERKATMSMEEMGITPDDIYH